MSSAWWMRDSTIEADGMVPFFAAVLAAAILKSVTDRSSPGGSSQEMIGEGGIQPGGGTGHHCKSFRRFRQVPSPAAGTLT